MASLPAKAIVHLKVEFDKDKVEALEAATKRFTSAQQLLLKASQDLGNALEEMKSSLTVKRED